MGVKGKTKWVGSKCHIVETAEKGKINFITGMIYQKANESDQQIHNRLIELNGVNKLKPKKMYTDQNYISGESIVKYKKNGQVLLGRITSDNSRKPDAFKLDKFKIDTKNMKATCPMNKRSIKSTQNKTGYYNIYFSKDDCIKCVKLKECVGTIPDKRRRLNVNPNYYYIRERREFQETKKFKNDMRARAQVEGTISELVRKHGMRIAKFHGEKGHQFQFYQTGAALNLKRYLRAIIKGRKI